MDQLITALQNLLIEEQRNIVAILGGLLSIWVFAIGVTLIVNRGATATVVAWPFQIGWRGFRYIVGTPFILTGQVLIHFGQWVRGRSQNHNNHHNNRRH